MKKQRLFSINNWIVILFSLIVCLMLIFSIAGAGVAGHALADEGDDYDYLGEYPAMYPDEETLQKWLDSYYSAPLANIDIDKLGYENRRGSQSVLNHLQYIPSERDQGSCGNCWVWAGTGSLAVALDVQEGIKDRLSIQYLNSCSSGSYACGGGWLYDLADFYDPVTGENPATDGTGRCIPWANDNAEWQDGSSRYGDGSSDVPCPAISTVPYYPVTSINEVTVPTQNVAQWEAIANIKYMLDHDNAIFFGFFVPSSGGWVAFSNFWKYEEESTAYNIDVGCNKTGPKAGHAVLCVGYDDSDPENSYWVMLNSWGTTGDRPNGLFRINMDMDYAGTTTPGGNDYCFFWQTLDVSFGDMPDIELSPVEFEKTLLQYSSATDTLNIGNTSEDDLSYSISAHETGGTGFTKRASSCPWLEIDPDSGTVPGGAPAESVSIIFNTTGLDAGDYTADIVVSSNDPGEPEAVVPVTLHVEAVTKPLVTSSTATDIEEETALLNGQVDDCGGIQCDYRGFIWGDESYGDPGDTAPGDAGYDNSWTETGSFDTGIFNLAISGLSRGNQYYYRACAHNSAGWSYGDELTFITKSVAPLEFNARAVSTSCIELSWIKGEGAQQTKIQRKQGNYPTDRNDGSQVYFGTGSIASDKGLLSGTDYYYRAWSWVGGSEQWSDGFAQAANKTASASYNITLAQGWNLVSLPLVPLSTNMTDILSADNLASGNITNISLVYWFDAATVTWKQWINGSGTLTTMEDGLSYWLYAETEDTLTVFGTLIGGTAPDYPVLEGWNMIGFSSTAGMPLELYLSSIAGNYSTMYRWNADSESWSYWMESSNNFYTMNPGYGYWLYMTAGGTITPP